MVSVPCDNGSLNVTPLSGCTWGGWSHGTAQKKKNKKKKRERCGLSPRCPAPRFCASLIYYPLRTRYLKGLPPRGEKQILLSQITDILLPPPSTTLSPHDMGKNRPIIAVPVPGDHHVYRVFCCCGVVAAGLYGLGILPGGKKSVFEPFCAVVSVFIQINFHFLYFFLFSLI